MKTQKITKHTLYIGLNDKDTKQQEITTLDAYKTLLRLVDAVGYEGATITEAIGYYKHENGEFVTEKSLMLSVLFADDAKTIELIKDIKKFLNQESVALQKEQITSELI